MQDNRLFHVTVKGLVYDAQGRVLLLKERAGGWDLPGGRLEHGETSESALKRECREEMGVECRLLEDRPRFLWTAQDRNGTWRFVICYAMELESFDFHQSEECVGHNFFSKTGLDGLDISPQTRKLKDFLNS